MSRLKFRAYHKKLKLMQDFSFSDLGVDTCEEVCFLYFENPEDKTPFSFLDRQIAINDENLVVMQYLGEDCKDEGGKEMCKDDLITYDYLGAIILKIEYSHGIFFARTINDFREIPIHKATKQKGIKIIGNIHQNPELWK